VGGVAGAVGGDKIANAIDNYRINNQRDKDGNSWHYDPGHPTQGWTRTINEIDPQGYPNLETGMPAYKTQTLTADPALTNTLNYKASNTAVDLALAHPNTPKDPYSQPAGPGDTQSIGDAPWARDPQTQTWSRHVTDQVLEHGITIAHNETATPSRAAQLNHAADQTIAGNLAQSPRGMAQQYQAAYEQYGWQQQGPMPAPVSGALKTPANILQASDGHTYTRGADGQWNTPGMIYGTNAAEGNLRDELNATQRAERAHTQSIATPHPPTATPHAQASPGSPVKPDTEPATAAAVRQPSPAYLDLSAKIDRFDKAMQAGDRAAVMKEVAHVYQTPEWQANYGRARETVAKEQQQREQERAQNPRDPRDAGHPDHAMNQSIRKQVETLHERAGTFIGNKELDHLTASVANDARKQGMTRVDQVQFSADKNQVVAMQGGPQDMLSKHSVTNVQQAMQTPPEHAYQQMGQETQRQAQVQQNIQQQTVQTQQQGPSLGR